MVNFDAIPTSQVQVAHEIFASKGIYTNVIRCTSLIKLRGRDSKMWVLIVRQRIEKELVASVFSLLQGLIH